MKDSAKRIKSLAETLATLIEQEERAYRDIVHAATPRIGTSSQQIDRLTTALTTIETRMQRLGEMAREDLLAKVGVEVEGLRHSMRDSRVSTALSALVSQAGASLATVCESLLDALVAGTGAERGFIVFYLPESTEVEVIAARNYQTRNLALEEYRISRTLLRETLLRGEAMLVHDSAVEPALAGIASIRELHLKSVLVVPICRNERTVGAFYLENSQLAGAFDEEDLEFLQQVGALTMRYLERTHTLPAPPGHEPRLYLDEEKMSNEILGNDPAIRTLLSTVKKLASSPATVLLEGESGTGKDLVARALHREGRRRDHPFVAINCAAIPEMLLESELFGHERGAFTGATERQIGRFEQADGGTIFLDEIGDLASSLQAKLLRFLQENELRRLGGRGSIRVDVRVVAATSRDLEAMARAGKFHDALYYRLNVIPLRIPPLRERLADVPLLVEHFIRKFASIYGRAPRVDESVYEVLSDYPFPGNVRELENLVHRLVALGERTAISIADLPKNILTPRARRLPLASDIDGLLRGQPSTLAELEEQRREMHRILTERERLLIGRAIGEAGNNVSEAAHKLGVHRTTLYKLLKKGPMAASPRKA